MTRLLIRAIADRKIQSGPTHETIYTAAGFKNLLTKNMKAILRADRMSSIHDATQVSSTWGAMISDLLNKGTFDPLDIVVSAVESKAQGPATKDGTATATKDAKDQGVIMGNILSFGGMMTFGCSNDQLQGDGTPGTATMIENLHFGRMDHLHLTKLAIQRDLIKVATRHVLCCLVLKLLYCSHFYILF